ALALLERFPSPGLRSKVYVVVSAYEQYWAPLRESIPRYRQAITLGIEAGDFTYASYAQFYILVTRFAAGDHLNELDEEAEACDALLKKTNNRFVAAYLRCLRQVLRNLRFGTRGLVDLSDDDFDEDAFFAELKRARAAPIIFRYCCFKQQLLFLAERHGDALAATETAESYARSAMGSLDLNDLHFYKCLILLALAGEGDEELRRGRPWRASQRRVNILADACPENFRHKALLIAAEEARVDGDELAAFTLFDRAVELARAHGFRHHVALGNKLAGRFHDARGRAATARAYLSQAHRAYVLWGAASKAAELAASYTHVAGFEVDDRAAAGEGRRRGMVQLPAASSSHTSMRLDEIINTTTLVSDVTTTSSTASSAGASGAALDFEAVLKASRALSGEIELASLLRRLMEQLVESAGAERGYLLLPRGGELFIEASCDVGASADARDIDVRSSPVARSEQLSRAIVNYVARTNENVVLSDASSTGHFAADPYIAESQPRSILCTPLVHQGKQIGLLYLENNLTAGAFTVDRLRVLYILSAQAAISIENARLYASMAKSERKFRSLFEDSNDAIFVTNRAGELLEVNRATLELFGYTADEVARLPGERLFVDADDGRDFRRELEPFGALRDFEVRLRKKDGAPIDCLLTAATMRLEGDAVVYQGIIRDITERKRAARLLADYNRTLERTVQERTQEVTAKNAELSATLEQLERTQDQLILNEKMASLGTLSAGIAHELKNPLNFINNFAELSRRSLGELREELDDAREGVDEGFQEVLEELIADLDENVQTIKNHGARADSIIQSMLYHARTKGGPAHSTDINALLASELNLAYHGMRVKNEGFDVAIETDYDPELPALQVVPQDLSRVFLNIMNNGIYAAWEKKRQRPGADFTPRLRVRTRGLHERVEVRIFDNGTGIPDSIRDKIFTPFFTSKPPGEGTGLGLSMSHDIIVQKYGGDIAVDSVPGRYSEFIITLPRSAPASD
ncbi:MAG: PAS domain S-box protein, partial [Myxococcales bacterium]|nr:PAS domain S-box protein [Myxococcales bacterium]